MTAGVYNWILEQGATLVRSFIYHDSNDQVVNLTGATARLQIRPYVSSGQTLLELTTANGKLVIDGAAGKITMTITPADTDGIDFDTAVYDLEVVQGGSVTRLLEGTVYFSRQVTR